MKILIIIRPDGILAGRFSRHELAEQIRECRLAAHQMRHRAQAERAAAAELDAVIAGKDLGGVSEQHPDVVAFNRARVKALAYDASAQSFEELAAQLASV